MYSSPVATLYIVIVHDRVGKISHGIYISHVGMLPREPKEISKISICMYTKLYSIRQAKVA